MRVLLRPLAAALIAGCLSAITANAGEVERGHYLFDLAGCVACHTDVKSASNPEGGPPLAGGRALKTPFGVFYSPNITADVEHGIGGWSEADFLRALRHGKNPKGEAYFPVFPYPTYTNLSDRDILDLRAYIFSLPTASRANRPHETGMIFGNRLLAAFWQALFFEPGPLKPDSGKSPQWNRGAYLIEALGHCRECHTPRGLFGNLESDRHMAGTNQAPEGGQVPNITQDRETGIGKWTDDDLQTLFTLGMLPDGDFVGDGMAEVITNTTSKWRKDDLAAAIDYLKSLPPVNNRVGSKKNRAPDANDY